MILNDDDLPSLSKTEAIILEMLLRGSEQYGLEMVENSNGRLKRGTVYVTLGRMEDKGIIASRLEPRPAPEVGIARRIYSITGLGQLLWSKREHRNCQLDDLVTAVGA